MTDETITASPNMAVDSLIGAAPAEELTNTEHEEAQIERANASGATPVVFVHGLWLLPSSWDRWVKFFEGSWLRSFDAGLA